MDSGKRLKTMDRKKYIFFSAAFLFLSAVHPFPADAQYRTDGGYSGLYDSETAASMRRHVSDIASAANRGRKAGSDGETAAAAYLYDALKNYGVEMLSPESGDEFGISRASGDTLTSRNVVGFVQGYDARLRNRYVVVGARPAFRDLHRTRRVLRDICRVVVFSEQVLCGCGCRGCHDKSGYARDRG